MNDTTNSFRTVALTEAEAAQTLPLAQVTWPGVDLDHWQKYIRSYAAGIPEASSGIVALRDASDYFCAMFAYRVDLDVHRGSVLMVQLFTAVDLANSPTFSQRLLTAAEAKARELGCASVEIRLYRGQTNLALQLRYLGLVDGGAIVSKRIEGPPLA
jgi:hypothetical protein